MADWEIWRADDGREVRIQPHWLSGRPRVAGEADLVDLVKSTLRSLGPYDETVTVPVLEADLVSALVAAGLEHAGFIADHDLAASYLRSAVEAAERSAHFELEFMAEAAQVDLSTNDPENPMKFIMAKIPYDRAIEASRSAVILAVAALEAFINQEAYQRLSIWEEEEDRQTLQTKWILVPRQITGGATFNKGLEPFQSFNQLVKLRNNLVHPKAAERRFEGTLGGLQSSMYRPGWDAERSSGRWACVVARRMLVEYGILIGEPPPSIGASVPPSDPQQPEEWRGAVIMAGTRPDPDYPRRQWPPDLGQ